MSWDGFVALLFLWTEFCDWYIGDGQERLYAKPRGKSGDVVGVFVLCFEGYFEAAASLMPFITEEIFSNYGEGSIMRESWTKPLEPTSRADELQDVMEVIRARAQRRAG
jgi:valyl-tRNA synthetase